MYKFNFNLMHTFLPENDVKRHVNITQKWAINNHQCPHFEPEDDLLSVSLQSEH